MFCMLRLMSLNITVTKRRPMIRRPPRRIRSRVCVLNALPLIVSATLRRIWPPSRIGIGRRWWSGKHTAGSDDSKVQWPPCRCSNAVEECLPALEWGAVKCGDAVSGLNSREGRRLAWIDDGGDRNGSRNSRVKQQTDVDPVCEQGVHRDTEDVDEE